MSNTNNGGPAFPANTNNAWCEPGMTLRDYFAAKAIQGLLAAPDTHGDFDVFAQNAYEFADAMLRARDGGAA